MIRTAFTGTRHGCNENSTCRSHRGSERQNGAMGLAAHCVDATGQLARQPGRVRA